MMEHLESGEAPHSRKLVCNSREVGIYTSLGSTGKSSGNG